MTKEELIKNLKYTMKKHEHDRVDTFGTNISLMCKDVLDYLEQEPKWIPCSERLPEEGEEVLVSCYDTYHKKVIVARYQGESYGFTCGLVSAWMPMPEPYKAESEEEK